MKSTTKIVKMGLNQAPVFSDFISNRQRRRILHSVERTDENYTKIYNNLVPEVHCAEKLKIGSTDDGGKWILPNDCVIYSLGMYNDIAFEEELQKISRHRCQIHSFDAKKQDRSVLRRLKQIRATGSVAKVARVTDMDQNTYSLEDLMKMYSVKAIEILKMDIEGFEFEVLEEFLKSNIVSQILVEIHGKPYQVVQLLRMVSERGYLLFHFEINGAHPHLCEYSFIHHSVLTKYGAIQIAKYLS